MSTFPRPSEWHFAEGDEVYLWDDNKKRGNIKTLRVESADVVLTSGDKTISVPWVHIHKIIRVSEFVKVTGGAHQGREGWAVDDVETINVHVNLLVHIDVPFVLGSQTRRPATVSQFERIPWINAPIIITAVQHPLRTHRGIIKDVLCNQSTSSGLRVVIQLTSLMMVAPITLDYDDVIEASRLVKLYNYAAPKTEIFIPRNHSSQPVEFLPQDLHAPCIAPSLGSGTPMPEQPLSSSPAWDPSSRTPQLPESGSLNISSSPTHPPPSISSEAQHMLLDPRLLNVRLRVYVNGGRFNNKELTVSIHLVLGQLVIRRMVYKTSKHLQAEWVTAKHPNPTRDNGLLIIIKGHHCGKYVRRIHHRYEAGKAILILAVVHRETGRMDKLTGEELQLDASHICVCDESKGDKMLNSSLMLGLREEARKIRAK